MGRESGREMGEGERRKEREKEREGAREGRKRKGGDKEGEIMHVNAKGSNEDFSFCHSFSAQKEESLPCSLQPHF